MGNNSKVNSTYATSVRRAGRSLLPLPTFSPQRIARLRNRITLPSSNGTNFNNRINAALDRLLSIDIVVLALENAGPLRIVSSGSSTGQPGLIGLDIGSTNNLYLSLQDDGTFRAFRGTIDQLLIHEIGHHIGFSTIGAGYSSRDAEAIATAFSNLVGSVYYDEFTSRDTYATAVQGADFRYYIPYQQYDYLLSLDPKYVEGFERGTPNLLRPEHQLANAELYDGQSDEAYAARQINGEFLNSVASVLRGEITALQLVNQFIGNGDHASVRQVIRMGLLGLDALKLFDKLALEGRSRDVAFSIEDGQLVFGVAELGPSYVYQLDFSEIGTVFGNSIGSFLADSEIETIALSSVFGTIGSTFGSILNDLTRDATTTLTAAVDSALGDISTELITQLRGAVAGSISSVLSMELGNLLGVEGFGGELLGTVSGSVLGVISNNAVNGTQLFQGLSFEGLFDANPYQDYLA